MKIALLGDTALYGKFCIKNGNAINIMKDTVSFLSQMDYVILNLETPFETNNAITNGFKSAYIKSLPENVELLKKLNVSAVNLANNHIYDYGLDGYSSTKKILIENGIKYFGVDNINYVINDDDNRIAFSGYCCYSTNPIGLDNGGINPLDYKKILNEIDKYSKSGYNSIVSIHAGQEHVNMPNRDHIKLARKISDKYSYVYYGHHPHVLQGIEKYKKSLHIYSLGNFCFDDVYTSKSSEPLVKMSDNNKTSGIIVLEYERNTLLKYSFKPLYDGRIKVSENVQDKIIKRLEKYSRYLSLDSDIYEELRIGLIADYLNSRKKQRDITWYLKRLNYKSVGILINAYNNRKKYRKSLDGVL